MGSSHAGPRRRATPEESTAKERHEPLHDLLMWDNRRTLHRVTEFDDLRYTRDMQRATVSDIANTCEQQGIQGVA